MATETSKTLMEGYLTKQGAVVKSWKKRYFMLIDLNSDIKLCYYENKGDKKPKGVIAAEEIEEVRKAESQDHPFYFEIDVPSMKRTYHLSCETEKQAYEWIRLIKKYTGVDESEINEYLKTNYPTLHV